MAMKPVSTVALVMNLHKPAVLRHSAAVISYLRKKKKTVLMEPEAARILGKPRWAASPETLRKKSDLALVMGGDGTFLHTAAEFRTAGTPLFGINFGSLGFLNETGISGFRSALEDVLAGRGRISTRMMLEGSCKGGPKTLYGLNEIALIRGSLLRTIRISCFINSRHIGAFKADGILVATPTGSTAYSLSAHGPVMEPGMEALIVNPVCPHTLAVRPLIVPGSSRVRISWSARDTEVLLSADGQERFVVPAGADIHIRKSSRPIRIFTTPSYDFFGHLGRKLDWIR